MRRACVLHSSLRPGFILCTSKAHIYSPRSVCRNITNDTAVPSRIYVRLRKVNSRLPFFLQKYTTPLLHAPASHITAFLLLHEITALVPLFGLTACFHYANWVPESFSEGEWVSKGMEKWGGYLRKKGWLTEEEATVVEPPKTGAKGSFAKWWDDREGGSRVLLELGAAYAIVKLLMPLRIMVSVWATPVFARLFIIAPWRTVRGWISKPVRRW